MQLSGHNLQHGERLSLIRESTGETLERWRYEDGSATPEPKDWIRLYQRMAAQLMREPTMTLTAHRVWGEVLARTSFGNSVEINLTSLAKDFGCARKSITNAVKTLIAINVIERRGKTTYRLNPNYGWKGTHHWRERQADKWASMEADKELSALLPKIVLEGGA